MKSLHIIRNLLVVATLCLVSCSEDDYQFSSSANEEGGVTLSFISDPMQEYNVPTRADIKEDDEKRINQLYIFFFGSDDKYLKGGYLTGYQDAPEEGGYYAPGEGVTTLKLDNDKFTDPSLATAATIFVVANVEPDWFKLGNDGRPTNVTKLDDLEKMIYKPENPISLGIPKNGIPMVGKTTLDLTAENNLTERTIQLTALMARIDVTVQIDSPNAITNATYPALRLMDWTVSNIPNQVAFASGLQQPEENESEEQDFTETSFEGDWKVTITTPRQSIIHNRNGQISLSFYMFENRQKAEWKVDEGEEWQSTPTAGATQEDLDKALYPAGLEDYQKQHYKPYLANANAASIELHGSYSTYNETGTGGATYDVRYTLYLGEDFTSNFEVKSNHQYKNNVTIKGLTQAGTNPDHITFDARVNITDDETSNKYYIAILRERNHDAHFCVTPMDVYLFADALQPTMEVILGEVEDGSEKPKEIPDWIRMERVSAADMEEGTFTSAGLSADTHINAGAGFHAGHGKRKYFTTDLIGDNSPLKTRETIQNSRDRIYFYLDENLTLQDKSATVTLIYKENGVEKMRRTLQIVQVHLLPIKVYDRDEDGNKTTVRQTIYMEQYEEYLDHYDPLDEFVTDQIYKGLPWIDQNSTDGKDYTKTDIPTLYRGTGFLDGAVAEPQRVYYEGLQYTDYIVQLTNHLTTTLNDKPAAAFEYCYNKNKRKQDGTIPSPIKYHERTWVGDRSYWYQENDNYSLKWFLPGIRQMEDALTEKYSTYTEFQEELYWSVSAGAVDGIVSLTQDATHARATGIDGEGNYVESNGSKANALGYKGRTESCRIRAFRIDLNEVNY